MFDTQKLAVFVPASETVPIARIVALGSAIVGKAGNDDAEQVTVITRAISTAQEI